jgi:hypothetical protein
VFDAPIDRLLPRVYCYFDDTLGLPHSDFAGPLLPIGEFNAAHESRKVGEIRGLRHFVSRQFSSAY